MNSRADLKIGILSDSGGWHTNRLIESLASQGIKTSRFRISRLVGKIPADSPLHQAGVSLPDLDALIVRAISSGSLEQIVFRMDALARLERAGVWLINPAKAIERTVDKYYTTTLLTEAGLKVAPTIVAEGFKDAMLAFDELGGDVVVKPIFGGEGRGMVRVDNIDLAYRTFKALEFGHYVYYLQKFIPHNNRDWRAFVIEDHVVAAMERRSNSWKTNFSQGAQVAPLQLPEHLMKASIKAAKTLGCQIAGVDLLPAEDGEVYFTEVNSIPGWRGLYKATGIAIHDRIVDYIIRRLVAS